MTKRIYSHNFKGNYNKEFPYRFITNKTYNPDQINNWGEKFCQDNYMVVLRPQNDILGYSQFYFKNSQDAMLAKLIFK